MRLAWPPHRRRKLISVPLITHTGEPGEARGTGGSTCANRVDPVGVVFIGATLGRYSGESHPHSHKTVDMINDIPDWNASSSGDQYASSHSVCTKMEYESGTNCGSCSRYHVRLNQTHHQDLNGRYETVGTPHWEVWFASGTCHSVPGNNSGTPDPDSGFDLGRGHLKQNWLDYYGSDHLWDTQNWGNTQGMYQPCNGDVAASSGRVYWLKTDSFK